MRAQEGFKSKIARIYEFCYIQDGAEFKKAFSEYVKPYYQRNLISLFAEVQVVYEAGKGPLIEEVFLEYYTCLEKETYPDGSEAESPS